MIIKFTQKQRSKLGLLLGPILFVIILLVPIGEGLSFEARIVLATTIWMDSWWLTEAIPIYVTGPS